jgi:hypothetical protein
MKAEEVRADYSAMTWPQNVAGRVPFGEVTVPKVDQGGPLAVGEFTYVDISSVDNKLKRITEYKTLAVEAAPSRAKQHLKSGDVLVSMTRPNLNAVAIVPPELDGAVGSTGFHVLRAAEQARILAVADLRLSQVTKSEREVELNMLRAKKLGQSILTKAFGI